MSPLFISLLCGLLFGAGLAASDMNNPERVQGFLDIFGNWDPSLMFVMGGALFIAIPGFQFLLKNTSKPILGKRFYLPLSKAIDKDLILGAVLFGTGWAIVGYCPGPAIAALGYGYQDVFIFVGAMLVGAKVQQITKKA
jgi:uncharacterized membrane protein YedE/YeeE